MISKFLCVLVFLSPEQPKGYNFHEQNGKGYTRASLEGKMNIPILVTLILSAQNKINRGDKQRYIDNWIHKSEISREIQTEDVKFGVIIIIMYFVSMSLYWITFQVSENKLPSEEK